MKKYIFGMLAAAVLALGTTSAMAQCQSADAAAPAGYANIRSYPDLSAPVIAQISNPENGSDYGSIKYCGREYYDPSGNGRMWSFIYVEFYDGRSVNGWVSDKVLRFYPY